MFYSFENTIFYWHLLFDMKSAGQIVQVLSTSTLGNPHSLHGGTQQGEDAESIGRRLTLDMCNADPKEYDCVFTSGATGKILDYLSHLSSDQEWRPTESHVRS